MQHNKLLIVLSSIFLVLVLFNGKDTNLTSPSGSIPAPPYTTAMRKELATEILANQNKSDAFKVPFVVVAVLRLIAKDGGTHTMSDQSLYNWAKVGMISGHAPTPNPVKGITSLGAFLERLSDGRLWTRVAEFAVGAVLIGVGVNAIFKGAATDAVASVVKKVA
jgi:hypothetical protein